MNAVVIHTDFEAAEMSVVGRSLSEENEVKTMTTSTVVAASETTHRWLSEPAPVAVSTDKQIRSSANYNTAERLVAGIGLALLRWSNRRADRAQPTHARMALILENEALRASNNPARPLGSH